VLSQLASRCGFWHLTVGSWQFVADAKLTGLLVWLLAIGVSEAGAPLNSNSDCWTKCLLDKVPVRIK
jgi:hypothetical protein